MSNVALSTVYLVGAGPGAPDLLTLRAARLLERADIVFYDALVHPETIALAVNAKKVAVGKRAGQVSTDQRFINRSLVEAAARYQTVVRLKGGDPMLFGRAQEEIDALRAAGIRAEIIPGITAALAASAQLGISLTKRGVARSVTVATPRIGPDEIASDWVMSAVASDTIVLYMAVGQASQIATSLIAEGKPASTPVAVVENATLINEQKIFTTLAGLTVSSLKLKGPAVLCIGEVFSVDAEMVNKVVNKVVNKMPNEALKETLDAPLNESLRKSLKQAKKETKKTSNTSTGAAFQPFSVVTDRR